MENTESTLNIQITKRDLQYLRMKKVGLTGRAIARLISSNEAKVSLYFFRSAYPELEPIIEKLIAEAEQKRLTEQSIDINPIEQKLAS